MRILLLSPEFPDTFWSFKHALKFIHRRASSPPLGLLTVAAMLPREWEKRLVDLNVARLTDTDLAWADYAFVGGMVVQRQSARAVIARCKAADVPVVAGGPLFTTEHEEFPDVDHFVLNEAELTLPPFLADLGRGCAEPQLSPVVGGLLPFAGGGVLYERREGDVVPAQIDGFLRPEGRVVDDREECDQPRAAG